MDAAQPLPPADWKQIHCQPCPPPALPHESPFCGCPCRLCKISLLVLAAQGFAIFVTGIARRNRIALSFCGLWGVLSFSVSGFTFPVPAMPQLMQLMSDLFPMRHYYLLYVDQALNGIPMAYSWKPYLALVLFVLLPLLTLPKLKLDLQENRYLP